MRGLANIGNTCGFNSLVQCIGHVPALRTWLLERLRNEENNGHLSSELMEILDLLWNQQKTVIPRKFIHAFVQKLPMFPFGEQHDLSELWTMLADKIGQEHHSDLHKEKHYNVSTSLTGDTSYDMLTMKASHNMMAFNKNNACDWTDLVQGVQISQLKCENCQTILHNIEPWAALHVPFHDSANVAQCIEKYMNGTMVDDWICEKCKTSKGEQVVRFWKLPKVFVVTMKRFEYDVKTNSMKKQSDPVHIPDMIEFSPAHVVGPEARSYMKEHHQKMRYNLWSMGLHHGDAGHGHYTAVGRVSNNEWTFYDDAQIHTITSPVDVLQRNPNVYMLFYMRDDDDSN
jgi:ubiquitin C-terminal hydrolase